MATVVITVTMGTTVVMMIMAQRISVMLREPLVMRLILGWGLQGVLRSSEPSVRKMKMTLGSRKERALMICF